MLDLGCGSLFRLRETANVSLMRYVRDPRASPELHEKIYPLHILTLTTAGVWRYDGHHGSAYIDGEALVAGNPGTHYGCAHSPNGGDENLVLSLQPGLLDENDAAPFEHDVLPATREITGIFRSLANTTASDERFEALIFDAFERASAMSLPERAGAAKLFDPAMIRAKRFIEERHDAPLTVREMAASAGLSPFAFVRRFKARHAIAPYGYLLHFRIARAQELLRYSSLDVRTIASTVGFPDIAQFSRAFRRHSGISPSMFRKEFRSENFRPRSKPN